MSKLTKYTYILLLLIAPFAAFSQAPKSYTIENIGVTGAVRLSPKTIIAVSGLKVGDNITIPGTQISNAVKNIWNENLVSNVNIKIIEVTGDLISLDIIIEENLRLSKVEIEGVSKKQEKDLNESFALVKSQVLSDPLKKNIKFNIEKFYKEKGFYNVKVYTPTITKDTSIENHQILTYKVDKGPKLKINEITIDGENFVTEKLIKRKLKKTKEITWWKFYGRSKYLAAEYKLDQERVVEYYNSIGMRDMTMKLDSIYNFNRKSLNLKITIEEGHKYYFGNITWVGNSKYSDKQLNAILGIKKGDIFNKSELDSKLNFNPTGLDISSLYLDDGYLFFSVTPLELRADNDSIDIEMRIYEGQQATIGDVRIYGNTKTSDHVIMREIYTLPGNKFSRSDLINSQQIIARLGYFDPEKIGISPIPNMQDGTVDIEYTVAEKPSDQLQLSGGWGGGGQIGFVGTLGVVFSNFSIRNIAKPKTWDPLPSGDGQRLSIQMQANGKYFQNYAVSFSEPWLGGKKPNNFTVSFNHSLYGKYDNSGSMAITGASLSLGRRLRFIDPYFSLSNSLSYYFYNIDNYSFSGSSGTLCPSCQANNLNLNTTLSRSNSGPNLQFPTKGSDITLSIALTPPYSLIDRSLETLDKPLSFRLVEYNKIMFDYSSFLKISARKRQEGLGVSEQKKERPLVLHTRFHFGVLGRYNQNMDISPFERFRMGGTGINGFNFILGTDIVSLRGYTQDALYPDNVGGIIYDKMVTELRYPIVTEGVATIYGFGFFEAGNNWGSYKQFNPLDLKRSAGFGASLFMNGIGNISFGYGYGFDKTPFTVDSNGISSPTNKGQFLFSIGSTIR